MRRGIVEVDNLIIWAGSIPEENIAEGVSKLRNKQVWAVFGDSDEYISQEEGSKRIKLLKGLLPDLKHFVFKDSHRINEGALKKIASEIYQSRTI